MSQSIKPATELEERAVRTDCNQFYVRKKSTQGPLHLFQNCPRLRKGTKQIREKAVDAFPLGYKDLCCKCIQHYREHGNVSTYMTEKEIREYRRLQNAGWNVDKTPQLKMNHGTESFKHLSAKAAVATAALDAGYLCSTEVGGPTGEIDILAFHPDRINWCIEVERNIQDHVVASKKTKYVDSNNVIDDICVIPVDPLPTDQEQLLGKIKRDLPFNYE